MIQSNLNLTLDLTKSIIIGSIEEFRMGLFAKTLKIFVKRVLSKGILVYTKKITGDIQKSLPEKYTGIKTIRAY